jgi:hypothetical protein
MIMSYREKKMIEEELDNFPIDRFQ